MQALRPGRMQGTPGRRAWKLAVAGLCGMLAAPAFAQEAVPATGDKGAVTEAGIPPLVSGDELIGASAAVAAPSGPLKVLSWNVASSPYAIAMRKIKSAVPSWRTSFGSERRTIEVPTAPRAEDIDADIVLLQGITTPRAMRRLFPARKWRLIFSRRALESLPKGSVFTAPVSSVEIEAVAVRFRQGLRVIGRAEDMEVPATVQTVELSGDSGAFRTSPGVAVKILDRGKPVWLASISVGCGAALDCDRLAALQRWREARATMGEVMVAGGRLAGGPEASPCDKQSIEFESHLGRGETRPLFGCVAELMLP